MKAFVTDGDERSALAITRSLGRRGVSVLVGAEWPASLASSSRYCVRHVTYPSPYQHPEAFRRFLLAFVRREKVDVVVPVTDVTTHVVSRNQDDLRTHTSVAVPPFEAFDDVSDKWSLVQRAEACGIPVPRTHVVDGAGALKAVLDRVEYPAVVKPARSRMLTARGWSAATVQYAHSAADLRRIYQETECLASYPSLIQERILGPGMGLFALFDRGRLVTAFAHRRLREKPPSGGVSVLRESLPLDRQLTEQAIRMLAPLGWHGVAMMEYKQDCRTGQRFLMEVNGRFWGSLQLAIDAGVDFPHLSCQLAIGDRLDIPPTYRVGVKSRWLLGDLDHLLLRMRYSDRDLHLPDGAPSKARTVLDFLKFAEPGLHYEIVNRTDVRPFLYEVRQYVKDVIQSRRSAARRLSDNAPQTDPVVEGLTK
jgi:predicted ATP-grasp superfamily ATP-dependent carboligase